MNLNTDYLSSFPDDAGLFVRVIRELPTNPAGFPEHAHFDFPMLRRVSSKVLTLRHSGEEGYAVGFVGDDIQSWHRESIYQANIDRTIFKDHTACFEYAYAQAQNAPGFIALEGNLGWQDRHVVHFRQVMAALADKNGAPSHLIAFVQHYFETAAQPDDFTLRLNPDWWPSLSQDLGLGAGGMDDAARGQGRIA